MRIIAGRNRGRTLKGPAGNNTLLRPTSDRAREALFNIIGPRVNGSRFLDLFAGTGAVGLEALSRGAGEVVMVEANAVAAALITANIDLCAAGDFCRLIRRDLGAGLSLLVNALPGCQFDLVFLDPPYESGFYEHILADLVSVGFAAPDCMVIAETRTGVVLPDHIGGLAVRDKRKYGENSFWFYQQTETA